jgi:hypothetical protein
MNSILRFLNQEDPVRVRQVGEEGKCEEPEGPVGNTP